MAEPLQRSAGPWVICDPELAKSYIGKQIVAYVRRPGAGADLLILAPNDVASTETQGNAALIAAAGELLRFVRRIARRDPVFAKGHEKDVIAEAGTLVAKAEGRADG